jgi:hypothetical protein
MSVLERESIKVLQECIELQVAKSNDYQNPNSSVVQADHYRRGIDTIFDTMNGKMLRIQSLLEAHTSRYAPKHESIEDSLKDLINYASFGVSWLRGKMEGQDTTRDIFNKKKVKVITADSDHINEDGTLKDSPIKMGKSYARVDNTENWEFSKKNTPSCSGDTR